jgi:isopenicillin N synthase-like dioxygenase
MNAETDDLDLHPPAPDSAAVERIPVIDIAALVDDSGAAAAAEAADLMAAACRSWGFFQVVNHGIDPGQLDDVWKQTHALFALPAEDKLALMRSSDNPWGFYNNELTKNQRDRKEIFDFTCAGPDPIYGQRNRWPGGLSGFEATMLTYLRTCAGLSLKLLEGFCLGLGLPADYLRADFDGNHTGFVRLNHYPVDDPMVGFDTEHLPDADLGIHHHTDAGALTVLLQDETTGLQVHRDGYWHDVPTIPGALVINTGDMMQVWSNDTYNAPVHRVRAMDRQERYSIAFFFNPAAACQVSPLPSLIGENGSAIYRPIHWGAFRSRRSEGDFADYGTEVQIAQYRL